MTLETACPKPEKRIRLPKQLKARKGLRPVNPERRAERFERDYGPKSSWVRDCLLCVVSGSEGSKRNPIVVAHVRGRGAGGDSRNIVPMLASLHDELHAKGQETFAANYPWVNLEEAADLIEDQWQRFVKPERMEYNPGSSLRPETIAGFTNR